MQNSILSNCFFFLSQTQQNVGWLKRKALNLASVTVTIKHDSKTDIVHVDSLTSGVFSSSEDIYLDGKIRDQPNHPLWGHLKITGKKISLSDLDDQNLKEGWAGNELVQVDAESESGKWKAIQVSFDKLLMLPFLSLRVTFRTLRLLYINATFTFVP